MNAVVMLVIGILAVAPVCGGKKTAFLCITGQFGRLELASKLMRVVDANCGEFDIDVMLVLASSSLRFTNSFVSLRRNTSLDHAAGEFLQHGARHVWSDIRRQIESPNLNAQYLKQLNKPEMNAAARKNRAINHYRQWEALSRCWSRIENQTYDVYLRIRDDAYFWAPLNMSLFVRTPGVYVAHCNSYRGINDRGAIIVGMSNARLYYTQPLERAHAPLARNIDNPETYLAHVLRTVRVPIHVDCTYSMTFVSSRTDHRNQTCVTMVDRGNAQPSPLARCRDLPWQCAPAHIVLPNTCAT